MNVYKAFQILELKYHSTEKEVKQKYKDLVKQYHPDVCDWDSTAYFQKINHAYEVALDFASKNKNAHKPQPPAKTTAKQPVKTDTRKTKHPKKKSDASSSIRWIIAGVIAFLLACLMVPGMQLIVLLVLLYGVTRILK